MLGSLLFMLSGLAFGQEAPEPVYRPTIDGETTFMTDNAGLTDDRGATVRVLTSIASAAVDRVTDQDTDLDDPISRTDIMGGYQLGPVRVGVDVPIYALSIDGNGAVNGGLGDIGFDVRGTLADERSMGFGLALQGRAWVPSSTMENTILDTSNGGFEASAIADKAWGGFYTAANLGISERDYDPANGDDFGDDAFLRLAASAPVGDIFHITGDVEGRWRFDEEELPVNVTEVPLTTLIGGVAQIAEAFDLRAAIGAQFDLDTVDGDGVAVHPRASLALQWKGQDRRDRDLDGFANLVDVCPDEAEDFDGFMDDDGCPDLDNDGDSVADLYDDCPNIAGSIANDGCPEAVVTVIERTAEPMTRPVIVVSQEDERRLELDEIIYFAFDSDDLTPAARSLLGEVALELKAHPNVDLVWLKGHADERGTAAYNLDLSQRRAKSVYDYLIMQGVDPNRLDIVAFGESRPADPGHNPAAWQKNRRVEFEASYERPNE